MLAALALIWGSSFLLIKVGLRSFEPFQLSLGRIGSGAITLCALLLITRDRLPRGWRIWMHAGIVGLFMNVIPFTLFGWGETHLGSIEAGIWNATTPLFTLLVLLFIVRDEPIRRLTMVGLLVGFVGVVFVLAPWEGLAGGASSGHLAFALGAACYGLGTPYMRRVFGARVESVVALSAAQLICGTALLIPITLVVDGVPSGSLRLDAVLAVLTLGAIGTGIAYVLFTTIIRAAGPAIAASVTYLQPIVSTTLGALVLHETIGWNDPVGAAIILVGVAITAIASSRKPAVVDPG
ncbi:MAG: EamA family transporter [Thermoleophilia bacterium]|nr:EamA family transporter [Thermoleophilia bacterium]